MSDADSEPARHSSPNSERRSYPWHVRAFIIASTLAIVVRSTLNIGMHHMPWLDELGMYTVPFPLPAASERSDIANGRSSSYRGSSERLADSAASVLRFLSPWPSHDTAARLVSYREWLAYAAVWTHTRLEFVGRLIGVDQRWTMYSPSVGTSRKVVRAKLHYEDGTTREVRSLAEPDQLATFVRPFAQRRLQHDVNLTNITALREVWALELAQTYPRNTVGSPLLHVDLHWIRHPFAPPTVNSREYWQAENNRDLTDPPIYRLDVAATNRSPEIDTPSSIPEHWDGD